MSTHVVTQQISQNTDTGAYTVVDRHGHYVGITPDRSIADGWAADITARRTQAELRKAENS